MSVHSKTKTSTIVVTRQDLQRLRDLIGQCRTANSESHENLRALETELERAHVVDPHDVPDDVVTIHSTVRVRAEHSKRAQEWTLVYPHEANIDEDRISILAPLGTALLGYRVGDTFEWEMPTGRRRYRIAEIVHQPEAAGEWDR